MRIDPRYRSMGVIGAAAIMILGYLFGYSFPLGREHAAAEVAVDETKQSVALATHDLTRLRAREARSATEAPRFAWAAQLIGSIAKPYLVETPAKFSKAIRQQGLPEAEVELAQLLPFPGMPDFAVAKWELRLAKARALPFGEALAAVENQIPLGQVHSLKIQRNPGTADAAITLQFDTLVQP